jgi:hypothetical protein
MRPQVERLKIGKGKGGFTLPLDLTTSTQAILARKRSGKSYTASVQAEELLEHNQQVIVFDPTSAWYGLRSSAEGNGVGYPIVVFGGDHADAPLDSRTGKAMAAAVVEHGFSAIFDIGNLHTEEQLQFVMDFCSELLRTNRAAMHVFMDEADTFAPQKPLGFLQNKCLGTVSRLVKQGGIRGVGFTMITQRPASMNKDVLSQVDILTVLRMSHPLDIKAATDWIKSEVTVDFAKTVEAALPSLPVGTAFFCSASLNLGERVEVRSRHTFNSGATPKPGERKAEPTVMYGIDIEKLGKEISASVQKVKEESPEYLKRRIAELEIEIAKGGKVDMGFIEEAQAAHAELETLRVEAAAIPELRRNLEVEQFRTQKFIDRLRNLLSEFANDPVDLVAAVPPAPLGAVSRQLVVTPYTPSPAAEPEARSDIKLRGASQKMLAVCARMHPAGITEAQVAMQSGMKRTSGTFGDYKSLLKTSGCIDIRDGVWTATKEGMRRAGTSIARAPRTTAEVLELWTPKLRGKSKDMLNVLVGTPHRGFTRAELAKACDMEASSGTFGDYLSLLRTAGLIVNEGSSVRANRETLLIGAQ